MPTSALVSVLTLLSGIAGCLSDFVPTSSQYVRTPEERFSDLPMQGYPWQPHYLNLKLDGKPTLRMHYIDVGPADAPETILLLHGTPSWSFLYRKMIPLLLDAGHRVVAPDFIGFGRSDKLTNPKAYTHQLHVDSLLHLVRFLNLQDVTLFGQDLGGPTGLSVVRRENNRFKQLVLLNTWIPQGDIFNTISFAAQHFPYLLWRKTTHLIGRNVPVGLIFGATSDAPIEGIEGYKAPYPSSVFKAGPAQWPLLVPLTAEEPMAIEMQKVKHFLQTEWTGPVLFGYSDKELFTRPGRDLLQQLFDNIGCEVLVLNAGHFLQEDQPEIVSSLVISFIDGGCRIIEELINFVIY